MERCCFCLDIRSGTIASAVFVLITRTLLVILFSIILGLRQKDPYGYRINYEDFPYNYESQKKDMPWYYQVDFSNARIMISIGVGCFHLLFSTLLLIGVRRKKKSLFLPWIVLLGLEIFISLGVVIMIFVMTGWVHAFPKIISMLIGISFQCYMLSCVTYYYKQLAARENTVYNVIPLNSSNIPPEVTNTTTPFYSNAGLYDNTPTSISDQPPKYENLPTSFNNNAMPFKEKPPPYDDIRRNDEYKGY